MKPPGTTWPCHRCRREIFAEYLRPEPKDAPKPEHWVCTGKMAASCKPTAIAAIAKAKASTPATS